MKNDTIESLLVRHFGNPAATPVGLEDRLLASVHQKQNELTHQRVAKALRQQQAERRRAVRLVAIGAVGLGVIGAGLESLLGQEATQPAYS